MYEKQYYRQAKTGIMLINHQARFESILLLRSDTAKLLFKLCVFLKNKPLLFR